MLVVSMFHICIFPKLLFYESSSLQSSDNWRFTISICFFHFLLLVLFLLLLFLLHLLAAPFEDARLFSTTYCAKLVCIELIIYSKNISKTNTPLFCLDSQLSAIRWEIIVFTSGEKNFIQADSRSSQVLSRDVIGLDSLHYSLLQLALQPVTPASTVRCEDYLDKSRPSHLLLL